MPCQLSDPFNFMTWIMRYENLSFVNVEDKDSDVGNDNDEGDDW